MNTSALGQWFPFTFINTEQGELLRWCFAGETPFAFPFFEETVAALRHDPRNSSFFRSTTSIELLKHLPLDIPAAAPAGIIFHVSRCGSTLFSQLLTESEKHIVLPEVPLFNHILHHPQLDRADKEKLFAAVLHFHVQKRTGHEERFFIKTDSWHIYDAAFYRRLFPNIPFVFLYREPAAVLQSHRKMRGMQMVPGQVRHPFDFTGEPLDEFTAKVLAAFYTTGSAFAAQDKQTLLLDYSSGLFPGLLRFLERCGDAPDAELLAKMTARAGFHSKSPREKFRQEEKQGLPAGAVYEKLQQAYDALERLRASRNAAVV